MKKTLDSETAVLYLRLSSADGPAAESDSIQNQRSFLQEWANGHGFRIEGKFVDDGHTGTDFDHPGFQELNRCLMDGNVRCIIVKDLSRLGRNYAETGRYLEQIFPRLGVRFIAVNDQYDSARNTDSVQQMAVFKNVFNDLYAADASAKVRTPLGILKRQGKFLGRQAPYGCTVSTRRAGIERLPLLCSASLRCFWVGSAAPPDCEDAQSGADSLPGGLQVDD